MSSELKVTEPSKGMLARPNRLRSWPNHVTELESVFECALNAILIADDAGRYTAVNPAAAELIGLPREQIIGRRVSDFSFGDLDVGAAWAAFLEAGEARGDFRLRRADGEARIVEFSATARIAPGRHLSILRDVTEAKRNAEALQQAARQRDEFLAMLSHELRNPLGAIASAAALLKSAASSDSTVEWSRNVIERQTAHLTRIVDDLLDATRIAQGKITVRADRIDLTSAASLALEIANPLIQKREQRVATTLPEEPLWIQGDVNRLAQAISNLLCNAAKFSAVGATIQLSVMLQGADAVVRVRDDGKGIPAALLPHVFDLFVQDEKNSDRSDGAGLGVGLALVRNIVELHAGQVEASSAGAGQGSEFLIRLPVLRSARTQG